MTTGTMIRRARPEDADTIARMVAALSEAEGGPAPHFDAPAYRRDGFGPSRASRRCWPRPPAGRPAMRCSTHPMTRIESSVPPI